MKITDIVVYDIAKGELGCGTVKEIDNRSGLIKVSNAGVTRMIHKSRIVSTTPSVNVSERKLYGQVMRAIG